MSFREDHVDDARRPSFAQTGTEEMLRERGIGLDHSTIYRKRALESPLSVAADPDGFCCVDRSSDESLVGVIGFYAASR